MISQAADYDFVDLANCPTGRFDGGVMPLRNGTEQDVRRMEDIAFLYEGVRDKVGALYGTTVHGVMSEPHFHPGSANSARRQYYPTPIYVPLTKFVSSTQMTNLCDYMSSAAAVGLTGVRFLTKAISAIPTIDQSDVSFFNLNHAEQVFMDEFEGVGPIAADRGDFAAGKPVAKTPVLTLFEDMKRFDKPCGIIGSSVISSCDESDFTTVGSGWPSTVGKFIGYTMEDYGSSSQYNAAWQNLFKSGLTELFAIPSTYIQKTGIKVWMLFSAYNQYRTYETDPGTGQRTNQEWHFDFRTGLINATSFLASGEESGMMKYNAHLVLSRELLQYIEDLYGWQEFRVGDGSHDYQTINVTYATEFIVEFAPNGRTKWWN